MGIIVNIYNVALILNFMKVQKRGAERGAGSFDRSLNSSGYPGNAENPRISRIAVYHCICAAPYMIRKGVRKGGRISRTLVGPHNAIYVICNASNVNFFTKFCVKSPRFI